MCVFALKEKQAFHKENCSHKSVRFVCNGALKLVLLFLLSRGDQVVLGFDQNSIRKPF